MDVPKNKIKKSTRGSVPIFFSSIHGMWFFFVSLRIEAHLD
jgi:hypothetical protein